MNLIPPELLEQLERGNVLLFIGERIARDADGQALIDRLTAQLAARCQIAGPGERSFPEVAQDYEYEKGRQGLVEFVLERLGEWGDEPQRAHRLIASLTPCDVLVTTCLDRRLEGAFAQAGRPLDVVIGNVDVAFEDQRKAQLYKLRGSVERKESLVLTEEDYEAFFEDQASVSVVLQGYMARKTILFVGYDLADPHFKRLYRKAIAPLDKYARRAYAFGETPPPRVCRWCKEHQIEVVGLDDTAFLEALAAQLAARAQPAPALPSLPAVEPGLPLPERPYKLLDYYEARDAAIFCGRRVETVKLASLIHAHRLVLLYGASGAGKTSLLLAGAMPRLENADPPYETVYVRALEDPALALRRALRRRLADADLPPEGTLVDFLDAATQALGRRLVIVLDQFEEFFIRLSPATRAAFIEELGALYDARDVPVKVVLSLREDWLAAVSEIEGRIPEVFRTRMRLLPLTREQARQAITEPAARVGVSYEPALVERLLDDLAGAEVGAVMPPQLQLVCSALYDGLGPGEGTITVAAYEQLGGARGVLRRYLEGELARLPGEERALARQALKELVTSQGTKAVKTGKELVQVLGTDVALMGVLDRLVGARLLRVLERADGKEGAYELAHEYLIAEIATWIDEEEMQVRKVRELLRREMDNWRAARLPIRPEVLSLIHERREELPRLNEGERELLCRSALAAGYEIAYWVDQADRGGVAVDEMAREGLRSERFRTRAAAVVALGQLGERYVSEIIGMLGDPYPQVRMAAIAALERLRPGGEWRGHLKWECYVPGGAFVMGSDSGHEDEKPVHSVDVSAFYMARYPVTNAEYKRYRDDVGRPFEVPTGKGDHPLVNVSWHAACEYAAWAGMRLPSEAEWEKAASWEPPSHGGGTEGGRKRAYPWGDEFDANKCNTSESGIGGMTPVGQYSPAGDSAYGCADMAGNVWEWTSSLYKGYPYDSTDGREDSAAGGRRVLRGGSWGDDARYARAAHRHGDSPDASGGYFGFRCVSPISTRPGS